ncbi:MAG: response regulator transcription factor [Turicibacter sp.]|nr:response regulator transcription factor [Turicibacter sp.]
MFKILLIEDEESVLEVFRAYLEKAGYQVLTATTAAEGLRLFYKNDIQLLILDLMLPDRSGELICKEIRQSSDVYIFMLTAKGSLEHRIEGLNLGADEYLVKPFSPRELVARVNALFRRIETKPSLMQIDKRLSIDLAGHLVKIYEKEIPFTTTEFQILAYLIENRGQVLSREQLIEHTLGIDFEGYDRTIDVHIKNIRKKIEVDTKQPKYILTVMKVSYKFVGEKL